MPRSRLQSHFSPSRIRSVCRLANSLRRRPGSSTPMALSSLSTASSTIPTRASAGSPTPTSLATFCLPLHHTPLPAPVRQSDLPDTDGPTLPVTNPDGTMNFETALNWVNALNAFNKGRGWLGHNNWQLPTNIAADTTCSSFNAGNFGALCTASASPVSIRSGSPANTPPASSRISPPSSGPSSICSPISIGRSPRQARPPAIALSLSTPAIPARTPRTTTSSAS